MRSRRKASEVGGQQHGPHTSLFAFCLLSLSCGIASVRCCTLSENGVEMTPDMIEGIVIKVEDTLQKGHIIKEYGTVNFTEIEFNDTLDYVKIKVSNGKLRIEVTQDLQGYEETYTKDNIFRACQLVCVDTHLRQEMSVLLWLTDTNNHVAVFGEDSYRYKLPMPFPPGIDISRNFMTIWAYDADFKSVTNFNLIGTDLLKVESTRIDNEPLPSASYEKPFYNIILMATTQLDTTEPIIFEITAEDAKYPGMNTTKVKVTIERDSELSVPMSPVFEQPMYLVQLKEEIHVGDELDTMPGPIRLEDASAAYKIEIVDGDEGFSSHFYWDATKNALVVAREFAEPEIPDARFGSLTLKATVKNAVRPGYSVVNIAFPEKEVPTTTMETTTLCPTTPEPPTTEWESTEDPCSKCPTPEPVTFPTCPTTEEPPTCPPCPTLGPTIPDDPETTSAYVSSTTKVTTTTNSGGHSTPTTLSTLWTDPSTSTTECHCPTCYCPTPEEVTCPEPPTCLPCPTFPSTVSDGGDGDESSFSGSTSGNTTTSLTPTSGTSGSTSDNTTTSPTPTSGTSPATVFTCPEPPTCLPCPTFPSTVSEGGDGDETSISGSTSGKTTTSLTPTSGTSGSTSDNTTTSPTPTSGTSPATDFTCPEVTTTVLPDPPENRSLKFQLDDYYLWARTKFVGVISRIVAEPYPPDLERWGKIEYKLYFFNKGYEGPLEISNGDLYCTQELEVKKYYFAAVAIIPGITEEAYAGVNLTVSPLEICQNGTNIVTIFPKSFMSITVQEEKNYTSLTDPIDLPSGVECGFHLEVTPQALARNFQVSNSSGVVSMFMVDREDKVFEKAVVPEIDVILSAECTISDPPAANDAFDGDDLGVNYASTVIHIRVTDIDDHPPVFAKEKYLIGYPEKSIAETEHPPTLGATVATDDDVGWYSKLQYFLDGLYELDGEVILDRESGVLYPHPQRFTYQDFSFIVKAESYYRTAKQNVTVKILSSKYLSVIHAVGKRLGEAQEVTDGLSKSTGLSVGIAGAPLMVANKEMNEQSIRDAVAVASEDRESSMIEEDAGGRRLKDPSAQIPIVDARNDESYYLRLVVYAFNGSEPVIADDFKSKAGNVSSDLRVVEYSSVNIPCDTSGAGAMSAAVTALAVILGLLVAAIVAFVIYRWRKKRRLGDNDSMESGLVQENDFRKEKHPMYDSERSSIVYENKMDVGEQQQNGAGDSSPERRKSVAFAEEPQVIPSEDDEGDIKM